MQRRVILEVLVDSVESGRAAMEGGADRLEVCQNLFEGGTTPSAGLLATLARGVSLPFNVMIRPRGGDFCYSECEFEVMRQDVRIAQDLGASGVVFGILSPDGTVDAGRTAELMALARPLTVTFHRAIDMTRDLSEALEALIAAPVGTSVGERRHSRWPLRVQSVRGAESLAQSLHATVRLRPHRHRASSEGKWGAQ
jgi:copper homeostasis protein